MASQAITTLENFATNKLQSKFSNDKLQSTKQKFTSYNNGLNHYPLGYSTFNDIKLIKNVLEGLKIMIGNAWKIKKKKLKVIVKPLFDVFSRQSFSDSLFISRNPRC